MSVSNHSRPYAIHSAADCDRLERQATLAGLPDHLDYVPISPRAHILDAGCGTGSMTRLLATTHEDAQVVGVDLREDYIAYAAERANQEGMRRIQVAHHGAGMPVIDWAPAACKFRAIPVYCWGQK